MNYRELKWGALKSYATKLGINTKGMTKEVLLEWLDAMPDVAHGIEEMKPFKGIKQHHPLFDEIKDYLPYLKAYKKLNAVSRDPKINITGIEGHEGKPFNCAYCLSFWTGLTLSICLLDISYMVIFLYFAKQD